MLLCTAPRCLDAAARGRASRSSASRSTGCSACRRSCRRRAPGGARSARRARRAARTAAPRCSRRCSRRRSRRRSRPRRAALIAAEPGLQALQRDHAALARAARRRHDAELAREVVHVVERAVAGDPPVAHRPLVDAVDVASGAGRRRSPAGRSGRGACPPCATPRGPRRRDTAIAAASGSPKCRSGKPRKLARMNSWTSATPRAGAGSAGSAQTMSSVTSSAIAAVSQAFQAAL